MAISIDAGRQWPVYAAQKITQAALANTDGTYNAIVLPAGARILGGALVVDTAFDDGTAATLSVGLLGTAVDTYLAATSIQAIAATALTGGSEVATLVPITITVTAAFTDEDATVGEATLLVSYILDGRSTETQ